MQLTIDSSTQKLEDVLDVVGAIYGVTIAASTPTRPAPTRVRRRPGKPVAARKRHSGPSGAEVRTWARSNGHEVADRGRIPAALVEAFQASGR